MPANWFLPLNTGHGKGQSAQQQGRGGGAGKSTAPPKKEAGKKEQDEDEWDTTSEEDINQSPNMKAHIKSKSKSKTTKNLKEADADSQLSPEEEARILPYMPALFSNDLPPCGPEAQVAYTNVNNRLRAQWLQNRGQVPTVDVCKAIREMLSNQNFLFPPLSQKGPNKRRKPWRREQIFTYELRWIEYFISEALDLENVLVSEKELSDRKKEQTIPAILGFNTDRRDVLKLWDAWHEKKRVRTPAVPELEAEASNLDAGAEKESSPGPDLVVTPSSTGGIRGGDVEVGPPASLDVD